MTLANRQRDTLFFQQLGCVEQQILRIKTGSDNDGGMASLGRCVAFARHHKGLKLNELTKAWLLLWIGEVASSRADKADIWDVGSLRSFDQFLGDFDFVLMRWRDQADGVCAGRFHSVDHLLHPARLVRHDLNAEFGQVFGMLRLRLECKAGDGADFLLEVIMAENELSDGVPCVAIDGGDADVA